MASRRGGSFATYAASSTDNGNDSANDFMRLSQAISNNIQKINQNVKKMYPLLDQYGTPSDSVETHDKLHEIQHYTNQLAKDTNNYIKDITHLQSPAAEQRQQKLQRERLVNEFTRALTSFQEAQRQEKVKEKTCAVKATPQQRPQSSNPFAESTSDYPSDYHDNRGAGAVGQQQIALQVDSSDVDMEILHEREEAIRKLEADITDVNQIFRDLGLLVHEQGEVVDSIESNVETAATHVEQGTQELHQASKYQSAARKKKCIIITIIVVVIAVIIIIIVVPSVVATKSKTWNWSTYSTALCCGEMLTDVCAEAFCSNYEDVLDFGVGVFSNSNKIFETFGTYNDNILNDLDLQDFEIFDNFVLAYINYLIDMIDLHFQIFIVFLQITSFLQFTKSSILLLLMLIAWYLIYYIPVCMNAEMLNNNLHQNIISTNRE